MVGDQTKKLRERLVKIIKVSKEKSQKSNLSNEEFLKLAIEAGKTFKAGEGDNNRNWYLQ